MQQVEESETLYAEREPFSKDNMQYYLIYTSFLKRQACGGQQLGVEECVTEMG